MMRNAARALALGVVAICGVAFGQSISRFQATQYSTGFSEGDSILRLRQQVLSVAAATANHALFHTSYMGEEDRVVANTAYGPVTARDLYLWLTVREGTNKPYILEAYTKARTASEKRQLAKIIREEIADYVFVNFVIPKLRPAEPGDAESALKAYIYALPGYHLSYIKRIVEQQVVILPADRIKYLQEHKNQIARPDSWRVRYIFRRAGIDSPIEHQDRVESEMRAIREQIATGETDFAAAAREHSQAPSAANGGEIPPFGRGELFYLMEDAAANLMPGELSEVFRGPGGYYMVQLIEALPGEEPNLSDPKQAELVQEQLSRVVLRGVYDWDLRDLLKEKLLIYRFDQWDLRDDCDWVARVCDFEITKQQFRIMFPQIEQDNLKRRDDIIGQRIRNIIEREAMAQDLRERGCEHDPLIVRSKEIALNIVRYENFVECMYRDLKVNDAVAQRFWRENPRLFTPLAMKRVVKVTLQAATVAPRQDELSGELTHVMAQLAAGTVPTAGTAIAANARTEAGEDAESLELIETTEETIETTEVLSVPPTGGAAAEPAAGGGSVIPSFGGDDNTVSSDEPKSKKNWEDFGINPVLRGDDTPDELITDPRPTKVPPLPLPPYQRVEPTILKDLVPEYKSSDFILKYEDLGFVYVADIPGAHESVDRVPVGGFSKPVVNGPNAISYFIEDARSIPKPDFESVKTQVYGVYRQMTVEKKVRAEYNEAIQEARIQFSF
jgi:hypothetical protein